MSGAAGTRGNCPALDAVGLRAQLARRRNAIARNAAFYQAATCQPLFGRPFPPLPLCPQFNLESDEIGVVRDQLDGWRQHISQPITLDVFISTEGSQLIQEAVGVQVGLFSAYEIGAERALS